MTTAAPPRIQRTAHFYLIREPLGRWVSLRISIDVLDEYKAIIEAGVRAMCDGASVEFEVVEDDLS